MTRAKSHSRNQRSTIYIYFYGVVMKKILLLTLLIPSFIFSQTIYYSQGSLDPTITTNWNTIRTGGGTSPSNFTTNNQHFVIQNGHTMTVNSGWSISGGSGVKLQIEDGGILISNAAITFTSTPTFQIDNGGTYKHNNNSGYGTTIFAGNESFASKSTVEINNSNTTGPSSVTFGNLIINFTTDPGTVQFGGNISSINGNFTIQNTQASELRLTSSSNVTISVGGNLTIIGGTLNFSSGAGNTILNLNGNFTMNGGTITETSSGSGTIAFTGTSSQTFTKSSGTINNQINFTINNATGMSLNNDLTINGSATLTMTSGNIDLNNNTITIGTGTGSTQVGNLSWTSGFIVGNGTLKRWIENSKTISIGEVAGLFPIGNSNNNRNVWIGCITTSSGGGTISVQHSNQSGYTDITSFIDNGISINRRHNMNWTITTADGLSGTSNFSLRIQGSGIPGINTAADLRLIRAGDAVGTPQNGSGTSDNPQVNRTGLTATSLSNTFYFGANSSVNPLPVELTMFKALVEKDKVKLNWSTATEVNNYGFEIERKCSNGDWKKIGFVQGHGNSNSPKNYTYSDQPLGDVTFKYRLKQVDFDGTFEYSNEVGVKLDEIKQFVLEQNYPNPFNPATTIRFSLPVAAEVSISVFNLLGERVAQLLNANLNEGYHEVTFDGSSLTSGIYFYQLRAGDFKATKKFIITK